MAANGSRVLFLRSRSGQDRTSCLWALDLEAERGPAVDPRVDPDGARVAHVSGGALHVLDLSDGTQSVLAVPGPPDAVYGLPAARRR